MGNIHPYFYFCGIFFGIKQDWKLLFYRYNTPFAGVDCLISECLTGIVENEMFSEFVKKVVFNSKAMKYKLFILIFFISGIGVSAQGLDTLHLWPGNVPGETEPKAPPELSPDNTNHVSRIMKVTDPAIVVYPAPGGKNKGAGVVVCPGGGYNILAVDLEGYEIATWLNTLGYTAFVLQYRVPRKEAGALQDVQRALRIVRSKASQWDIDTAKVGVLGFSAGGSLAARAETRYHEQTYTPVDKADSFSCRPSFGVLIYPAYLDKGEKRSLTPELSVDSETPPTFLFATADDRYSNSVLVMAGALRDAHVPVELHLMPEGGHGYGLRKGNAAAEVWPQMAAAWMKDILNE